MNRSISSTLDKKLDIQKFLVIIRSLVICFAGFMISRGSIGGYNPMIIAYYIAIYEQKKIRIWGFVFIVIGMITSQTGSNLLKYTFALTIVASIGALQSYFQKKIKFGSWVITGSITMFVVEIAYHSYLGLGELNIGYITLEVFSIIFLSLLYKKGILFIVNRTGDEFSKEVFISIGLIAGSVIIGIINFHLINLSITQVIGIFVLLILGYQYGLEASVIIGTIIGFATVYSDWLHTPNGFIMWSVLGIVAGLFREIGKIGTIIAYNITLSLLWLIYMPELNIIIFIQIMALLTGAFMLLPIVPKKKEIGAMVSKSEVEEMVETKLNKFADTYSNIGKKFANITTKKKELSNQEINQLIDDVASRVCYGCSMCNICWKKNFYETYKTVYSILSAVESKGQVLIEDIPEEFYNQCLKVDEFVVMVNRIFELYKTNLKWENKVVENRELFAEQFLNMAEVIKNLSQNLSTGKAYHKDFIKRLEKEIQKSGLDLKKVDILGVGNERSEVVVELFTPAEYGQKRELLRIMNRLKSNQYQLKTEKEEHGIIQYIFSEKENYRLVKGVAKINKNLQEVSGDNYSFLDIDNGKDVVVLSDGMGSGEQAFAESKTAIEMLEYMLEGGFDIQVAIRTVNAMLGIKNDSQSFATLDLSVVDRYTAECSFIKNGAVSTFLKREDKVEMIKSDTLPLGVLNEVSLKPIKKKLKADDIVIMVSDGIIETDKNVVYKEEWLEGIIRQCDGLNPQKIADYILDTATEKNGGTVDDDMTVLVFRIWERIN